MNSTPFLRIAQRFVRADLRRRMRDYVRALLGPVGRKNGWQLAKHTGHEPVLHRLARPLLAACAELAPRLATVLGPNSSVRLESLDVTIQDVLDTCSVE